MNTIEVSIFDIELDDQIQPRVEKKEEVIFGYSEDLANGAEFPPVDVFYDGETYWLADGFHRYAAYSLEGRDTIPAKIHEGGRREAIIFAAGANATHGIPRSNADKRRVVGNMLKDPEFNVESDNTIAEWCKVSQPFVSKIRKELTNNGFKYASIRKCSDGRIMETSNIGAKATMKGSEDSLMEEKDESHQPEIESAGNKEEEQVQASEQDDAEISPDPNTDPASESDQSSGQDSTQEEDEQDVDDESADTKEEEITPNVEAADSEKQDSSPVVESRDPSNEGKIESPEPESGEDPTDELVDINDVEILKAKIIELQNAIKEKEFQLQQKDQKIMELEQLVNGFKDTIEYYEEEIIDSIERSSEYSSSMAKSPNYQPMLSL